MLRALKKLWTSMIDCLYRVAVLFTFLGFIPVIISVYYYLFRSYDPIRVLVNLVVLIVLIYSNIKMQGGNM